ncbi:MAG: GGDEF domain-containing protein [Candidatus Omnitrophica bacterium]|nr:GGDEF domain-containing protein [Candidatus Omnitrophota bacterium]
MNQVNEMQKDSLTGAFTRDVLFADLRRKIFDAKLRSEKLFLLLLDIDHFKNINDKYGHLWGDEFLKFITGTLRMCLQQKGMIYRYGGDEFVVLFNTQNIKQALYLAKQFNMAMRSRPFLFNGRLFKMTISCGLAVYPNDAREPESLIKAADKALYFSKRFGRNTTTQVSKIGLHKLKMFVMIFLEIFLFLTAVFYLKTHFTKSEIRKGLNKILINRLPAFKPDTKVVFKDQNVISGHLIAENQDKVIVIVPIDKSSVKIIFKDLDLPR